MSAIWIVGAGTDIGKTYIACALIRALRAAGGPVDAFKPVLSGFDPAAPGGSDPVRLLEALGRKATPDAIADIAPLRFRAPLSPPQAARLEGRDLDFATVAQLCRERAAGTAGTLVLETAGGVMSPVDDAHTCLDLLAAVRAPIILVGGSYLGAISHTLTALETLRARGKTPAAIVISERSTDIALDEIVSAVRALSGGVPVLAAPCSADGAWDARPLLALLRP